jgi:chromosome segregation ATPase
MSVTAISMPPGENAETVDFLRRLASMMSGGKNAEMLLGAASMIEALSSRATTAERHYSEQQDEHEKSNELRQAAETAADNLNAEIAPLKAQFAEATRQAEIDRACFAEEEHRLSTKAEDAEARLAKVSAELDELRQAAETAADNLNSEIASLKAQLAEAARQAEIDRASFAEEEHRLSTKAEDAEARLAKVNAELDELRTPFAELSDTVVAVPTEQLRLARAQFDFLADGFARHGDVISQTICEIGRCAIEQALGGSEPARESN